MGCLHLPRLDANRTSKEDRPLQQLASSAMSRLAFMDRRLPMCAHILLVHAVGILEAFTHVGQVSHAQNKQGYTLNCSNGPDVIGTVSP